MRNLLANSESCIDGCVKWAKVTLFSEHIEDGLFFVAFDALLPIEIRGLQGTVCDVIIFYASLIVFFNKIVDSLVTENPVSGIDIALEDSGAQDNGRIAFSVDGLLDAVNQNSLLTDITVD